MAHRVLLRRFSLLRYAIATACLLVSSCASSGASPSSSAASGEGVMVTLHDYTAGRSFELASESHTNRVAYYSSARGDAARKIQDDEVMDLLLKEMRAQGLRKYAQEGSAPRDGGRAVSRAFQLEQDGQATHWLVGDGSSADERLAFNACLEQFLGLYNISASYQTVSNPHGHEFFEKAKPSGRNARGRQAD